MWKYSLFLGAAVLMCGCRPSTPQQTAEASQPGVSVDDMLAMTSAPQPLPEAPPVQALPAAPAVRYVPVSQPAEAYSLIEDAYVMADAFNDAPPDYGFDYNGAQPWVWRGDNGYRIYEASSDGGRYYYYHPNESEPYLVRDPQYAYAYRGGELVTVYDERGRILPAAEAERRTDWAGRYLSRARLLEAAAFRQRRVPVSAPVWVKERTVIVRQRNDWQAQRQRDHDWQTYRMRHEAEEHQSWAAEAERRRLAARDFDDWRTHGFRGQDPRVVRISSRDVVRHDAYRDDERRKMDARRQAEQQAQAERQRLAHIADAQQKQHADAGRWHQDPRQQAHDRHDERHGDRMAAHAPQRSQRPDHVAPPTVHNRKAEARTSDRHTPAGRTDSHRHDGPNHVAPPKVRAQAQAHVTPARSAGRHADRRPEKDHQRGHGHQR